MMLFARVVDPAMTVRYVGVALTDCRVAVTRIRAKPGHWAPQPDIYRTRSYLSLHCQELVPADRYRHILLQGELDQRLGRHSYLVSLGDYFRPRAHAGAHARADCCSFTAAGQGADD